jgi:hypothetical protein
MFSRGHASRLLAERGRAGSAAQARTRAPGRLRHRAAGTLCRRRQAGAAQAEDQPACQGARQLHEGAAGGHEKIGSCGHEGLGKRGLGCKCAGRRRVAAHSSRCAADAEGVQGQQHRKGDTCGNIRCVGMSLRDTDICLPTSSVAIAQKKLAAGAPLPSLPLAVGAAVPDGPVAPGDLSSPLDKMQGPTNDAIRGLTRVGGAGVLGVGLRRASRARPQLPPRQERRTSQVICASNAFAC